MLESLFPLSEQFLELQYRPYMRYFIKQHTFDHRFTIIRGQRGVGKSTVLVQLLRNLPLSPKQILYVPVDHFLLKIMPYMKLPKPLCNMVGNVSALMKFINI